MAFVKPITIEETVVSIHKKEYLLPAIQREFVWDVYQIERLFDSILRGYPISSFLFWSVKGENTKNYQFYEFIREYHEVKKRHNPQANVKGTNDIIAILDGQQRLTSLYIGLMGTYAYKLPRKRRDREESYPERKLYVNLVTYSNNSDLEYNFRFLTKDEAINDNDNYWYIVGDILSLEDNAAVNEYLIEHIVFVYDKSKSKIANKVLSRLYSAIRSTPLINFFLEEDTSLDKVLNIFIRVNSGGTQLSYSDLLLSIATAQWKNRDARKEITGFVDEINSIGDGFRFNKDFVLKCCLVLSELDIAFKVDNFNKANMLMIENDWDNITRAIKTTVFLISSLGYSSETLTSNNALIPIAYYLYKKTTPSNYVESSKYKEDRANITRWLISVLIKRTFSGQPDNVLRPIREIISSQNDSFPIDAIVKRLKGTNKAINFNDDEINNLLSYGYGKAHTFSILASIYPTLDFRNKFHQDHIFPKKLFTRRRLQNVGVKFEDTDFYLDNYNTLCNLQLLEGIPNQEKSDTDFAKWMSKTHPNEDERIRYFKRHYIPAINDYSLSNFKEFIREREILLKNAFKKYLIQ
jgi:uncharacterized protein with ParB-like and HNH nuclease domain